MAWARLDDRFHEHWKVADAGLEAVGLWTMCLTWASQARRTSPTPGVVPDSVIARFAGAKAKRLVKQLHEVGLLDDKADGGWPIHDFDEYLPKYDADRNRQNGSRGGRARAAKQTAKQTASEPLDKDEANREADSKQTSSMRASVRRNPVPTVPNGTDSEPSLRSGPAQPDDSINAGKIVKAWIDRQRRRPAERVIGQVAKQVRELLDEDFTADQIKVGLDRLDAKGLAPSVLASLVTQVANSGAPTDGKLTRQQIDDTLGPDYWQVPPPPHEIDPEEDWESYQTWVKQVTTEHQAQRERQALDALGARA